MTEHAPSSDRLHWHCGASGRQIARHLHRYSASASASGPPLPARQHWSRRRAHSHAPAGLPSGSSGRGWRARSSPHQSPQRNRSTTGRAPSAQPRRQRQRSTRRRRPRGRSRGSCARSGAHRKGFGGAPMGFRHCSGRESPSGDAPDVSGLLRPWRPIYAFSTSAATLKVAANRGPSPAIRASGLGTVNPYMHTLYRFNVP